MEELVGQLADLDSQLVHLASAEAERLAHSNTLTQLTERLEAIQKQVAEWKSGGAKRLAQVSKLLEGGKYALQAHKKLAKVDKELAA